MGAPRLTPHQRDTLARLERAALASYDGWVRITRSGGYGFGSVNTVWHLFDKGRVDVRRVYGPRGGEYLEAQPLSHTWATLYANRQARRAHRSLLRAGLYSTSPSNRVVVDAHQAHLRAAGQRRMRRRMASKLAKPVLGWGYCADPMADWAS